MDLGLVPRPPEASKGERGNHGFLVTLDGAALELDLQWQTHFVVTIQGIVDGGELHGEVGEADLPLWRVRGISIRGVGCKEGALFYGLMLSSATPADEGLVPRRDLLRGQVGLKNIGWGWFFLVSFWRALWICIEVLTRGTSCLLIGLT
ncbi:hypothetical protein FGO68_gene1312 [Halteria grandinella]|uniref:Uncharacterized protein n=1 Tax=Halteria grandinella TaxID=5974 RepID=A0A8J8P2C3_HALGN|nr:hypothetical protein FGO68_gene1312 [Halteria grandinella]